MIARVVEISSPGVWLHVREGCIAIERDKQELDRIFPEDLGVLVLDSPHLICSSAVLALCAAQNVAVIVCGGDHLPAGTFLPVEGNVVHGQRVRAQAALPLATKKRLWKAIIRAKIRNQADALGRDHEHHARLRTLWAQVKAGDTTNREAQAARLYWRGFFLDGDFRRRRDGTGPNPFLNYGYMVARAAMGRALCAAGLHPALGLMHRHRENAFALADDLLEPYRPYVDTRVKALWEAGANEFTREVKEEILQVLTDRVTIGGESRPVMVAMQATAASLAAVVAGEARALDLPRYASQRIQTHVGDGDV